MNLLVLTLQVAQAAALLGAAFGLSRAAARAPRFLPAVAGGAALAAALLLTRGTAEIDHHRALCSYGDCFLLVAAVAALRLFALSRETARLLEESRLAAQAAADAAAFVRGAAADQLVQAAAAALEDKTPPPSRP
ncbi:MAG: hypothetical protein B9S34_13420 [Opitutia bacterium Tous-C1TDCM]|nr:MAG: hypothetical protein B9S34_13420 [Opitutae bacterium Tous-C1TDCM]